MIYLDELLNTFNRNQLLSLECMRKNKPTIIEFGIVEDIVLDEKYKVNEIEFNNHVALIKCEEEM